MSDPHEPAGYDPAALWSTPAAAPLVPQFPIAYRDVRILTVAYRTDPRAIRESLPQQLEPLSDVVLVHLYDMPDVQRMGQVNECNVMIGARLRDRPDVVGGFTVSLYISSDVGLAQGREVHGQPKKIGTTKITARGDLLVGTVRRNGIRILRVTTPFKAQPATLDQITSHFDFRTNLNAKVIPHIDGTPAVCQITARRLKDVSVSECWSGVTTVEIQPNAQAPLYRLPVREPLEAFYWRADFALHEGEILVDLLKESRSDV